MDLIICLSIVMAITGFVGAFMSVVDIRWRKKQIGRHGGVPRGYNGVVVRTHMQKLAASRRALRVWLLTLVLSPLAIVVLPLAAICAVLWGAWYVVRLAFERDEEDEPQSGGRIKE